ncbi:STAS domain-containing protein [Streptoalloteichus hindustanus]|uniref:RsbT antagonist protein RsbS n=1 Tax=Streptoalloteichus hindustanus TaxID=2017 RepID=A0A1M4Y8T8_STRHI|nr:STAS domain-containing protein [Streptoalloteichus hindustanus]SHF02237.1 rsbT antagonist protein RsbS [Streptoalloteichus hindustanus]
MRPTGAVPVLTLGDVVLVSIQVELHDELALRLQQDLAERVAATGARGVVIDVSAIDIVDSFLAKVLHDISATAAMLASTAVVVGIRPAVAITLVELGLPLRGLRTAPSVDVAFTMLGVRQSAGSPASTVPPPAAEHPSSDVGRGRRENVGAHEQLPPSPRVREMG